MAPAVYRPGGTVLSLDDPEEPQAQQRGSKRARDQDCSEKPPKKTKKGLGGAQDDNPENAPPQDGSENTQDGSENTPPQDGSENLPNVPQDEPENTPPPREESENMPPQPESASAASVAQQPRPRPRPRPLNKSTSLVTSPSDSTLALSMVDLNRTRLQPSSTVGLPQQAVTSAASTLPTPPPTLFALLNPTSALDTACQVGAQLPNSTPAPNNTSQVAAPPASTFALGHAGQATAEHPTVPMHGQAAGAPEQYTVPPELSLLSPAAASSSAMDVFSFNEQSEQLQMPALGQDFFDCMDLVFSQYSQRQNAPSDL